MMRMMTLKLPKDDVKCGNVEKVEKHVSHVYIEQQTVPIFSPA